MHIQFIVSKITTVYGLCNHSAIVVAAGVVTYTDNNKSMKPLSPYTHSYRIPYMPFHATLTILGMRKPQRYCIIR